MTRRKVASGLVGSIPINFSATTTWAELDTGRSSAAPWMRPRRMIWRRLIIVPGGSDRHLPQAGDRPLVLPGFNCQFVEGPDLRLREEKPAGRRRLPGKFRLGLPGQRGALVSVPQDVCQDRLDVLRLGPALCKGSTAEALGMDNLEEKGAGVLFAVLGPAVAQGRQGAADQRSDELIDERQAVTLVRAEGQERDGGVRIGCGIAVLVGSEERRQSLSLALELLHAAHGDDRCRPVDHDRKANRVGRRESPTVRVRAERRRLAAEGDHI